MFLLQSTAPIHAAVRQLTAVTLTTRQLAAVTVTTRQLSGVSTSWRRQPCRASGPHHHFSHPFSVPPSSPNTGRTAHFPSPSCPPSRRASRSPSHVGIRRSSSNTSTPHAGAHSDSFPLLLKGREVCVPWLWLRDHCRCPVCYNHTTFQKNTDSYCLADLAVTESGVDGDILFVKWQDGHRSEFSLQWLADNFDTAPVQPQRFLWDGAHIASQPLPTTTFDRHMNTEDGLRNTLSNIVKYGFCVVDGAPATADSTKAVSQRICHILETVYGYVSVMVSGQLDHSDTAYTALPLGAHTDTTYFNVPAGLQVFHCLEHDGEGGNTLLVDGFQAAEKLRHTHPDYFDCLTTTPVPHEYIGTEHHFCNMATVLSTEPMSGQLTQIRFNPYDRAPLRTVSAADMVRFYDSYAALTHIIHSGDSEFWVKLKPGMVLFVDNWRVMHGRSGFTGKRVLCGCYLPRDDWTSHARVVGLL